MPSQFLLCSFKTCPWVQRAAIVLQEKRIPYDIAYIDRRSLRVRLEFPTLYALIICLSH